MNWLGIEAGTRDISLAFLSGSVAVERRVGSATAMAVRHGGPSASEAIPRLLARLRSSVGWRMTDLSAVAVSRGPGSFTGIRMGLAAARAFGMALKIPVVGVSTLEGLAQATAGSPPWRTAGRTGLVVTVLDALRSEVYVAAYRVAAGRLTQALPPSRCAVDQLKELMASRVGSSAPVAWAAGDDESFRALQAAGLNSVARVRPSALAVARVARRAPVRPATRHGEQAVGKRATPPVALYLREPESVVRWKQQPSQ